MNKHYLNQKGPHLLMVVSDRVIRMYLNAITRKSHQAHRESMVSIFEFYRLNAIDQIQLRLALFEAYYVGTLGIIWIPK